MSAAVQTHDELGVPAVVTLVSGVMCLGGALLTALLIAFQRLIMGSVAQTAATPELASVQSTFNTVHAVFGVLVVAMIVVSVFLLAASRWLKRRTNYSACIVASVFCIPTFGAGLYCLYVLTQPAVKASFSKGS